MSDSIISGSIMLGSNEPQFQEYLSPNEKILWTGRPGQGLKFRMVDLYALLSNIFALWLATFIVFPFFSSFTEIGRYQGITLLEGAWGVFIVAICLLWFWIVSYLLILHFFFDSKVRKNQSYAITNQRVIIRTEKSFASFKLAELPTLSINSQGTIYFVEHYRYRRPSDNWDDTSGVYVLPSKLMNSFQFLEKPKEVLGLILSAQANFKLQHSIQPVST